MGEDSLIDRIAGGDSNAVARAISKVEDGAADASELMKEIFPRTGRALVIGITGAPGAGKSSLVDKLAIIYRKRDERVGVIAADPSSPFTGGAILGDRIRMQTLSLDKGVFIRSMATRGNLGGRARATVDAVASPPRFPRVAIERIKTPLSRLSVCIRIRSPRIAPPENGLDGSTAMMPTRSPRLR